MKKKGYLYCRLKLRKHTLVVLTSHVLSLSSFSYSNNIVLETGDKYTLNEDGSELIIKDVKKVDEGDYTCIAKNKAGEKAEEVSLNVFGKRITPFAYDGIESAVGLFLSPALPFVLIDICCMRLCSLSSGRVQGYTA